MSNKLSLSYSDLCRYLCKSLPVRVRFSPPCAIDVELRRRTRHVRTSVSRSAVQFVVEWCIVQWTVVVGFTWIILILSRCGLVLLVPFLNVFFSILYIFDVSDSDAYFYFFNAVACSQCCTFSRARFVEYCTFYRN